jgi:Trk K+ transport system NAD-binding subunit
MVPRITGVTPLARLLEVAEIRVHQASPLAHKTIAESGILAESGAHIVGRWIDNALGSPPAPDEKLEPGMLLVAAGSPDSIKRLGQKTRPITQHGQIVVAGHGDVGSKLVEMLKDANEDVCVVDTDAQPGVDIVGDILSAETLDRAGVASARVVILACGNDSAALLASTVVRDHAPDVPIIACAYARENVGRIQQAGADFALSVSQVAGQLLAYHVLGKMMSQQARIKLTKVSGGRLAGSKPLATKIRWQTGCSIIAVERSGEVIMDFDPDFEILPSDAVYVCGTTEAFEQFYEAFPNPVDT